MEAFVIVFVAMVSVIAFFVAKFTAENESGKNREEKLIQLRQSRESLEVTFQRGRLECWDDVMMGQIADRIEEVEGRIVETASGQ